MLQNIQDRGLAIGDNNKVSRIHIEDALKRIFDKVGRPMSVGEIFEQLESFGYIWSSYHTAYNKIVRDIGILESAGTRGYYQLIRNR
jgi:hypothetical protein